MIVTLVVFRTGKNGSMPSIAARRLNLVATSLVTLALPVPGNPYFPLGVLAGYMPIAMLHPDHDHVSVLIAFPFFFAVYGAAAYLAIRLAIWAQTPMEAGR